MDGFGRISRVKSLAERTPFGQWLQAFRLSVPTQRLRVLRAVEHAPDNIHRRTLTVGPRETEILAEGSTLSSGESLTRFAIPC